MLEIERFFLYIPGLDSVQYLKLFGANIVSFYTLSGCWDTEVYLFGRMWEETGL